MEELKFLCGICKRFFKQGSIKTHWLFEGKASLDKEMLETRCFDCQQEVQQMTDELKAKMTEYDEENLRTML